MLCCAAVDKLTLNVTFLRVCSTLTAQQKHEGQHKLIVLYYIYVGNVACVLNCVMTEKRVAVLDMQAFGGIKV
jgi:hypothetical protein